MGDRAGALHDTAVSVRALLAGPGPQRGSRRGDHQRPDRGDAAPDTGGQPPERRGWTPPDRHAAHAAAVPPAAPAQRRLLRGPAGPLQPRDPRIFLEIERPALPGAPPEGDQYESIGQFYDAIRRGLVELCEHLGEAAVFCGDPARQVSDALVYTGSGRIVAVTSLDTALAALEEIVDQGEGAQLDIWDGDVDVLHPEREQVAHYFRFQELKLGRRYQRGDTPESGPTGEPIAVDWDGVLPMRANPRTSDHAPGSPIRTAQEAFNRAYCALLHAAQPGVQRPSGAAGARDRRDVRPHGAGSGPDADADRGRTGNRRPDLRVRRARVALTALRGRGRNHAARQDSESGFRPRTGCIRLRSLASSPLQRRVPDRSAARRRPRTSCKRSGCAGRSQTVPSSRIHRRSSPGRPRAWRSTSSNPLGRAEKRTSVPGCPSQ